jgi:glycosyltransferase involved in cell wall biosynthesis
MKKALIHDWIDQYGGAERVLAAISETMDFDYYYVYVNTMSETEVLKVFGHKEVNIVESNIFRRLRSSFRYFMPFFPFVVKRFNVQTKKNEVDLVISSSWALSKSYRIGQEIHICYLQARNFKYVWDEADQYFKGPLKLLSFMKPMLRNFDLNGGSNPDYLISNSQFVKNWIKDKYGRDSTVIYPPVDVEDFFVSNEKEDYFITVGRLQPYKRFDIIIDAFAKNGKKLIVAGDGSVMKDLQKRATKNIEFVGFKTKDELKFLLSKAQAFVFAGVEDFGIAIVEALAAGTPVIAYHGGASKELINESNGLVYEEQNAHSLNKCVEHFSIIKENFDSNLIRESALKFSKKRFKKEFKQYVDKVINICGDREKMKEETLTISREIQ